jgi:hypothetical protein
MPRKKPRFFGGGDGGGGGGLGWGGSTGCFFGYSGGLGAGLLLNMLIILR